MDTYTTGQVATLLQVNPETIRRWTKVFAQHLSVQADPEGSRARQFTEEDLTVLSLVATMKKQRFPFEDVHAALENGERGEVPELDSSLMTVDAGAVSRLRSELEATKSELVETKEENIELKARIRYLEKEIENALKLGRAEGELAAYRRIMDGKRGD